VVGCFERLEGHATGLDGMPVLSVLPTSYGYDRVDLEAIRERRPDVVLLDDLSRLTADDAERVPDVDAIRSLGIDVISTLRADRVRSLAGHLVAPSRRRAATVPDRALLEAEEVEVIAGDSRADLVSLARAWADRPRVPRGIDRASDDQPWPGRIVVAFDAEEDGDDVIGRAADLARVTGAHLVGANVRSTGAVADAAELHRRRELLEAVDADIIEVVDDSPGWALARVAEAEGAQVVVQRGTVDGQLVLDQQTASARGLDLYVVAPSAGLVSTGPLVEPMSAAVRRSSELPRARRAAGLVLAVVGVPLLTVVLTALRDSVHLSTVLLLYLTLTVAVAAVGGFGPGLLSAFGGFALGDYYFTRPFYRWHIADPNVVIAMVVFVAVAVAVSVFVDIAARRSAEAARSRAEAAALGQLASAVLNTRDPLPRLLHDLRAVFDLDAVAILRPSDDGWTIEHFVGSPVPRRPADATEALSVGSGRYLTLSGDRTPAEDSRVLAAFTAQLALAVDRHAVGDKL